MVFSFLNHCSMTLAKKVLSKYMSGFELNIHAILASINLNYGNLRYIFSLDVLKN